MNDYFADSFWQPELTRRENWDGREDLVIPAARPDNELDWITRTARYRPGQQPVVTIDVNHEVVN